MNLKLENVLSGNEVIWGMTFISSSKLIFTLKSGKIILLDINTKKIKQVLASPNIFYGGQGGLLDVQASPTFKKDRLLYFTYVKKIDDKAVTVLAQANLEVYELKNWKDLLVSKSSSKTSRHFGSRITFDENGHIYFSIGDRGVRKNAQDLSNHAGTIVRLNLDGTIPSDNPFINQKNKLPEIYSYGHRNPQGLFYDKFSKNLWSIEHGPRGGDEINLIKKGLNYGWPVISHGKEYWGPISVGEGTHKEGMVQAKKVYTPSIAPSSLIIYNHNTFSKWKGNLFSGALKLRHLNRIVVNKSNEVIKEERLLEKLEQRIRNVIQSPTGDLYISTDNGNIFKIVPDT
ncbi:MAG: PQQ-dependent sugar dehydrogenase [Arcobacter sp.]|nr:PQQ-dependent sugar dehydrogenase [Arcobacter sp.]